MGAMAVVKNPTVLSRLRYGNVERVLAVLRRQGPSTRADVAEATGLSRTTLSGIIGQLLAEAVLLEEPAPAVGAPAGRGRPVHRLSLNPNSAQAAGIEIGRERIKVVIANAAHEITAFDGVHCPPRTSAQEQAAAALGLLRDLADRKAIDLTGLGGVGIGTPGPGETTGGGSVPAEAGHGVPRHRQTVADSVAEALQVPVLADNNTRLAALGEAIWGAARGAGDALHVTLSYGVGGGLVAGGRLFRGAQGAAGEIGHISVDPDGPRCWCGGHGCMEQLASVPALLRASGRRSWSRFGQALAAGEEKECAALERAAHAVGRALAAACSTANPQRVVLGGEVAALGGVFLGPVEAVFRRYTPTRVHRGVRLVPAVLADRAGPLGALALVFHESPLLAGYTTPGAASPDPSATEAS
ncbi:MULTISPECIES: ROK family transcriptional regulator [unclassified Streptomyces]|uniref:ROK family transcriptional regulator n=1 Tax=unclassified Streptomyces TaxID=2593676 RepID=UPI000DB911EB|nr:MULTISPECIES: ROK family transcriptional regulator [unclassified Streptomyces]MYT74660.1 ROK family protein [Streptomyces sp. SID8367]RAJ91644.1 putative NBD/HSP70 family sugar kinase [Streptomyces sp. PsTaAH-137]